MTPADAPRISPEGKDPELILQVYGVVPPLAANVVLYAVPWRPLANELVVIVTGVFAAETLMARAAVAVVPVVS